MISNQSDLDSIAAALSDTQDQLLAISTLVQNDPYQFDIWELLDFIVKQALQILGAQAVFLAVQPPNSAPICSDYPDQHFKLKEFLPSLLDDQKIMDSWFELPSNQPIPTYVIQRNIRTGGVLSLGFQVDTPLIELNPSLKLADAIADQAQVQVSNIYLHKEQLSHAKLQTEMEAARQMQVNLLPKKLPDFSEIGLEVSTHFEPALMAGGDFYDLQHHPPFSTWFAVGDISGKGFSAALLMSMTLNAIRNGVRFLPDPTPKKILGRVNQNMYADFTQVGAFATVFIGSYNENTCEFKYVNAGHSPVIFCPVGKPAYLLEADAPGLGVFPESLCETHTLDLRPGDVLIIGTDGFSEAENADEEMFGYGKLLCLAEGLRHESALDIKNGFVDAINQFAINHPQNDDQTLLVIKAIDIQGNLP